MTCVLKERFKIEYISDASASYLVAKGSSQEDIFHYQVEMIANNSIRGILPFCERQKNDTVNIYYEITSRISLSRFLSRKKLSKEEFLDIIGSITETMLECGSYLLSERCLILDDDFIYIKPDSLEVFLVYLPVEQEIDVVQNFREFLVNLVVYSANILEEENDNFLQKLLSYARTETFSIKGFSALLKTIRSGRAAVPEEGAQVEKKEFQLKTVPVKRGITHNPKSLISESRRPGELIPTEIPASQAAKENGPEKKKLEIRREKVSSSGKHEKNSTAISNIKRFFLIGAALSQLLFAVIAVQAWKYAVFLGGDSNSAISGIALIILGIDYFLYKRVFRYERITVKIPPGENDNEKPFLKKEAFDQKAKAEKNLKTDEPSSSSPFLYKEEQVLCGQQEQAARGTNPAETTILGTRGRFCACLQGSRDGAIFEIPVVGESFVIGRLADQVDHVSNNSAVGKVHAEILCRGGAYHIKDLNSRNGTFLNGNRIESNMEFEIKNNDVISFANSEYIFLTPEAK